MSALGKREAVEGRVLMIGRSPAVMADVLKELHALGVAAEGETDPDRALARPDAASFPLVAMGRGITGALRTRLRDGFLARNPAVRMIDVPHQEAAGRVVETLAGRDPAGVDIEAYLARIGYDGPREPTLETLRGLVTAHLAKIPFEAIDAALGRGVDISAAAVDAKLIGARRGGYCYEQNGLLMRALAALGFEVDALRGRVRLGSKPGEPPMARTHMALKVTIDGDAFLADVGFGGYTPPTPLRLEEPEPQETGHERFRVRPFGPDRLLEAEVSGEWAPMYEISDEIQLAVDYEPSNWFTSTHPSSFFTRALVAARTTPEARERLYGSRLTVQTADGRSEVARLSADEIERVLSKTFGLSVEPDWRPLIERAAAEPA